MTLYVFNCPFDKHVFAITPEQNGHNLPHLKECKGEWKPYLTIGPTMSLQQLTGKDPDKIMAEIEEKGYCLVELIYEWS